MIKSQDISFHFISEIPHWECIVDELWEKSEQASIWNTKQMHKFRLVCLNEKYVTNDLSFVIYLENKPIGFFLFLAFHDKDIWVANYSSAPLYWPCFLKAYMNDYDIVQKVFYFIDDISRKNNIGKLNLMIADSKIDPIIYRRILSSFFYIDETYDSHIINLQEFSLIDIRSKYRQVIKKKISDFNLKCLLLENIQEETIKEYFDLHVLDAGGVHRSYETYVRQFEAMEKGGFLVCAYNKEQIPVGMLIIYIGKNESYEASVAIHPSYACHYISHLLKLKAIEQLRDMGVGLFELGQASYYPTITHVPSAKNYGINFFKDGWTRGKTRTVRCAVKFYTEAALDDFLNDRKRVILNSLVANCL
jgi:hypothetical protein